MNYISSFLTHWVGRSCSSDDERYDILISKILYRRELLFSYNPIPFTSRYGGLRTKDSWGINMVCFTDMPLSMSEEHCNKYSRFGIAFHKAPLANCLVCPVAYSLNPFIYEAYSFLYHTALGLKHLTDGATMQEGPKTGKQFSYDTFMQKLHVFLLWFQDYAPSEFPNVEGSLLGTPEQYEFFADKKVYYYEREWRAVYREGDKFGWVSEHEGNEYFRFHESSVAYLICPEAFCKRAAEGLQMIFEPSCRPKVLPFEELVTGQWDA